MKTLVAAIALLYLSSSVLAHDIYTNLRDRGDIYVVAERIVSQCRLLCCQMAITIYQKLVRLFPLTWHRHRRMIASIVVPIIQQLR
jgi:hypothetical protein